MANASIAMPSGVIGVRQDVDGFGFDVFSVQPRLDRLQVGLGWDGCPDLFHGYVIGRE